MPAFANKSPFGQNPVSTRDELSAFLVGILDALAPHTSPGGALIKLGHTATHYDETAAQLEGFSRPIWGLASLLGGGGTYEGAERWVRGFASGTDPMGDEFWGDMRDKDQRMVECSAIGFAISVAKEQLWDPLPAESKKNFENWLGGMNSKQMPDTNWLWFRVFANMGLYRAESSRFDAARMKADLDHLDTFYVAGGWSRDGPETVCQYDYYSSSFAIQFAQLVYSKLMRKEDPDRCEQYRDRARQFALDFVHYFDPEGRAIPFGRSMTYRFAQSSFWGALAFADVDPPAPLTWGIIKGLQLRNVRYWAKQPGAYNPDGTLTLGFNYPNHNMLENYNSPGSPYWCCKSFVTLALPPTHPFWAAQEESYPTHLLNGVQALERPLHIASHLDGHTYVLSSGQQCSYALKQSAAKYGKFAYSSAFGYSVPVGVGTLAEAGADSALALCDIGTDPHQEYWRTRRQTLNARVEYSTTEESAITTWLHSSWKPWPDVEIETWLFPPAQSTPLWHVRVHRIRAGRALRAAEGGFAVMGQRADGRALDPVGNDVLSEGWFAGANEARAASAAGAVGVVALEAEAGVNGIISAGGLSGREGDALRMDANTNLVYARAVLPTLMSDIPAKDGDTWFVTGVFGLPVAEGAEGPRANWLEAWNKKPDVTSLLKLIL